MRIATTARIVLPFPNPSVVYIAGANKGNPKPASDRKQEAAASAEYERFDMDQKCKQNYAYRKQHEG
jgi:hypothetical protein